MSRKGNCWDNAVAESFFSSLKKERIKKQIYKIRDLAIAEVADYIDTFYNRTRRHSHLGGLSPEQFEAAHKPRRPNNRYGASRTRVQAPSEPRSITQSIVEAVRAALPEFDGARDQAVATPELRALDVGIGSAFQRLGEQLFQVGATLERVALSRHEGCDAALRAGAYESTRPIRWR